MFARLLIAVACLTILACSSSKSAEVPWPERKLVETSTSIGGHAVSLLVPDGVGRFDDPNGVIWRDVSTDFAFFIKVFSGEHPTSLADAVSSVDLDEGASIIEKEKLADGYRVVVEEPGNKRHTVRVWKARGERAVLCHGILGQKLGGPAMVEKSNRWISTICGSVAITE